SAEESVFLAPWPEAGEVDDTLLAEVAEVRRVVELGRQARAASGLTFRQPLRRLVVAGAEPARSHAAEIAEELRVKEVEFVEVDTVLDDELRRERRVLDLIHHVNAMRREAGLELTDRIRVWIPDEDLLAYEDRIKEDTLAVSVEPGELRIEKA